VDPGDEVAGNEGDPNAVVRAAVERLELTAEIAPPGEGDQRDSEALFLLIADQVDRSAARIVDVEQDQVRRELGDRGRECRVRVDPAAIVGTVLQREHRQARQLVVLDRDQDLAQGAVFRRPTTHVRRILRLGSYALVPV